MAALAVVLWIAWRARPVWFDGFLTNRLTVIAGLCMLASGAVLVFLCGMMRRLGRNRGGQCPPYGSRRFGGQEGTAAVEFALVFPVALAIVLILIQSMLLMAGNLAVNAAAYAAARSAVVWIPEDLPSSSGADPAFRNWNKLTDEKYQHIRMAAVFTVLPISSGKSAGGQGDSTGAISDGLREFFLRSGQGVPNWVGQLLAAKYNYAYENTQVTLAPPADGWAYAAHEDLQVRVTHLLFLSVPYANRLFGESTGVGGGYATAAAASFALPNEGLVDEIDVEKFPRDIPAGG